MMRVSYPPFLGLGVRSPPAIQAPAGGHGPIAAALPPSLCSHEIWRGRKRNAVVSEWEGGGIEAIVLTRSWLVQEAGSRMPRCAWEAGSIIFCSSRSFGRNIARHACDEGRVLGGRPFRRVRQRDRDDAVPKVAREEFRGQKCLGTEASPKWRVRGPAARWVRPDAAGDGCGTAARQRWCRGGWAMVGRATGGNRRPKTRGEGDNGGRQPDLVRKNGVV